jgi:hypothetical protein
LRLKQDLIEAGFNWETAKAEELLAALRATYEPLLDGLASYLLLSLPGWSASVDARDHWVRGPRGTLAQRLVDELMLTGGTSERGAKGGSRWRRLRSRLRRSDASCRAFSEKRSGWGGGALCWWRPKPRR